RVLTTGRGLPGSGAGPGSGQGSDSGGAAPPDGRGGGSAAPAVRPPATVPAKITIPFDDNRTVMHLLGGHDEHLTLIEQRLGIDAVAHGNVVTLTGPAAGCEIAKTVLTQLYERI